MAAARSSATRARTKASPHVSLGLKDQDLLEMYYKMVLVRALDERAWALNRMGKVGFVASCRGQEATQVGSAYVMRQGVDFVVPYYRDLGVVITAGYSPREQMLALLARAEDPASGGRQMPGHWGRADLRIVSGSSSVATQIPHAVGIAYAAKLKKEDVVTIVYFGDGATSKGDFHEALNFAGIHKLPVIFLCEFNAYAISVPQSRQMAIENVAIRAQGYGFPGVTIDGNDILAVYGTTREAWERARRGQGPTLIEAKTYRLLPHSSDDDDKRYRSREEVEEWHRQDPLERFRHYLKETNVLDDEQDATIQKRVKEEVNEATEYAERAPDPSPETFLTNLFAE
jgi:2-oxoisovalerate dehydrogenase E1 component alpha subunit